MKDALTQSCLSVKQLGMLLAASAEGGPTISPRFLKIACEHVEHCDECWARLEPAVKKKERKRFKVIKTLETAKQQRLDGEPEDDVVSVKKVHLPTLAVVEDDGEMLDALFPHVRPKTRGECQNTARPCPWLGCRHHLWSDEHDGVEARVLSLPVIGAPSCVLDVVDEGKDLLPTEIGRMIQRRPEEVSENLESALRKCKEAGVFLRADAGSESAPGMWERITEGDQ